MLTTQGELRYTDGHGWQHYDAYIESFAIDSHDEDPVAKPGHILQNPAQVGNFHESSRRL